MGKGHRYSVAVECVLGSPNQRYHLRS
jgi:hypothetical protein